MIEGPELLIEAPDLPSVRGRPFFGSDVLADVLHVFRVGGAALLHAELRAPWSLRTPNAACVAPMLHPEAPASQLVVVHVVVEGECVVALGDGVAREELRAGDLVVFPGGDAHDLSSASGSSESRGAALSPMPLANLFPPAPWTELPRIRIDGAGVRTEILCFYLRCDPLLRNPLLESLPALLVARPGDEASAGWLSANVSQLIREALRPCSGSGCVVARLVELLFVDVLRRHVEGLGQGAAGWVAALGDRRLARALHAIHTRSADAWTATSLARYAGMSRSVLVERFNEVLGTSPMRYLADWRMQLAAQALLSSGSVTDAAKRACYASDEAFSRAFKRRTGESPAAWRKRRAPLGPELSSFAALSAAPSGSLRRAGSSRH